MKKCPKCGTILDDSKKKCYMCGTELKVNKNFLNNFDDEIGASVSRGQDNVFNNGEDISFKGKDLVKKNNDGAFFSQNSNSQGAFGNEINKLNSMSYDNRTGIQKGFDSLFSKKEFKSKDELNGKKITYSTNPNIPKDMQKAMEISEKNNVKNGNVVKKPEEPKNVKTFKASKLRKEEEEPEKKSFFAPKKHNEGPKDNLSSKFPFLNDNQNNNSFNNTQNNFNSSTSDSENKKYDFGFVNNNHSSISTEQQNVNREKFNNVTKNIDTVQPVKPPKLKLPKAPRRVKGYKDNTYHGDGKQMIINFICIVAFICMMIFVYKNFLTPKESKGLAGLNYKMDESFVLYSKDSFSRYYTYNNDCSLRINYGATNDTEDFVDKYLKNIADTYQRDEKATIQYEELKINDYMWTAMSVLYFPTNINTIGGVAPLPRYKYTAILNRGNFYSIIFVNSKEDKTCSEKYEAFVDTLVFEDDTSE